MNNYENSQLKILNSTSKNILVSASAGSGKTTIMIEKIKRLLIEKKVDINSLLVVTFTVLAATEMKQRLIDSIKNEINNSDESEYLHNLLEEISLASIDTIDGFCSKVIKKYFYKLNLEPNINIISGASVEYFISKAMDNAILKFSKNSEDIDTLVDMFQSSKRNMEGLKSLVYDTYTYLMALDKPDEFLKKSEDVDANIKISKKIIYNDIKKCIDSTYENLKFSLNISTEILSKKVRDIVNNLEMLPDIFEDFFENFINLDLSLPRIKKDDEIAVQELEEIKENLEKIKKKIENYKKKIPNLYILNNFTENYKVQLHKFVSLVKLFSEEYTSLKKKYHSLDFNDLERYMLKLLQDDDILNEFRSTYKYIFVDEFQDVNDLQYMIISKLNSNNSNTFYVGDLKQSIYGFRGSSPDIFKSIYEDYKYNLNGETIEMNCNFRSNPAILDFCNHIFSKLMTYSSSGIDYKSSSMFEPKRDDFPLDSPVEMMLVDKDIKKEDKNNNFKIYSVKDHIEDDDYDADLYECMLVRDKIKSIIGKNIYDAKTKKTRVATYSDIAILTRAVNTNKISKLKNILSDSNIPLKLDSGIKYFESEAIRIILDILKVVSFNYSDIEFITSITSPLGNFTNDELVSIRAFVPSGSMIEAINFYAENCSDSLVEKIDKFYCTLDEIRINASCMSNVSLIKNILYDFDLYNYLIAPINGKEQLTQIFEFLSSISNIEDNMPLPEFIECIEDNFLRNNKQIISDSEDAVVIQSIHASKGLEYPIVILFSSSSNYNILLDVKKEVVLDKNLGIGIYNFDLENRIKLDSIIRIAINLKKGESGLSEELRLLYVAFTRAKNKLIITGNISSSDLIKGKFNSNSNLGNILSVFKINLNKFLNENLKEFNLYNCNVKIYNFEDYNANKNKNLEEFIEIGEKNIKYNDFYYKFSKNHNIYLKNNVTAINQELSQEDVIIPIKLEKTEIDLNANLKANEIGNLYHKALQQMNFETFEKSKLDVDNLVLQKAFQNIQPLFEGAIEVKKEAKFMMYVKYNEIYKDSDILDKVLIQGVVDLMIIKKDNVILVDYKYSKKSDDALKKTYSTQLNLYKMAIEKCYKLPVSKKYIYSILSGSLIEV